MTHHRHVSTDLRMIELGGIACNCYLIRAGKGFMLVDTGRKSKRKKLERELSDAGCVPGNLDLIILTHGDFDHTGNCAYLREKYGTTIAMHESDSGMVERGDMTLGPFHTSVHARLFPEVHYVADRYDGAVRLVLDHIVTVAGDPHLRGPEEDLSPSVETFYDPLLYFVYELGLRLDVDFSLESVVQAKYRFGNGIQGH